METDYNKELVKNGLIPWLLIFQQILKLMKTDLESSNGRKPLSIESILYESQVKIPYPKLTEESILELLNNLLYKSHKTIPTLTDTFTECLILFAELKTIT